MMSQGYKKISIVSFELKIFTTMKKALTLSILITLLSVTSFAQEIYFRAGAGYGLPIGTTSFGDKYLRTQINATSTNTYSDKNVTGSYGAGPDFNFSVGYKFNPNIIFDLGFQYLMSNKHETYNNYTYINTGSTELDNNIATTSAKAFLINPSIIFSPGFGKGAPYVRFGIIAGSPTITKNESSFYNMDGTSASERTWLYKKGLALGYQSAIGMNWKITEKLDIFTEVDFVSMTFYPGEADMTKYKYSNDGINWTDGLPNQSVNQKQIVFKNSIDPNALYDSTKLTIALKQSTPFSSLSLQVGIRLSLWKLAK